MDRRLEDLEFSGTLAGGDGRLYECVMALADGVWEVIKYCAIIAAASLLTIFLGGVRGWL